MLAHDILNEKYETYGQFVGFKDLLIKVIVCRAIQNVNNTADNSILVIN